MMRHTSPLNLLKYTLYIPPQIFYLRSMSPFKGQDQPSKCRKMPCMGRIQAAFDSIWLETSCLGWNVHLIREFHTHSFSFELSIFMGSLYLGSTLFYRSLLFAGRLRSQSASSDAHLCPLPLGKGPLPIHIPGNFEPAKLGYCAAMTALKCLTLLILLWITRFSLFLKLYVVIGAVSRVRLSWSSLALRIVRIRHQITCRASRNTMWSLLGFPLVGHPPSNLEGESQ